MYEGTLYGHWEAIVTLQQMLVLCDSNGTIDMTPQAIAARTSIPLDILTKGIGILSGPDQYSRTPGEEGRRIILMDDHRPWGWQIVNYKKYRDLKSRADKLESDRVRIAEKRNKNSDVAESRIPSRAVANVAHAATDATTDASEPEDVKATAVQNQTKSKPSATEASVSDEDRFNRFWQAFPRKVAKPVAIRVWMKLKPDDVMTDLLIAAIDRARATEQWCRDDGQFIPHPATWLNQRRWEDLPPEPLGPAGAPWWKTSTGIEEKGRELGIPEGDKGFQDFKWRVFTAAGQGPWNEAQTAARVFNDVHQRAQA